MSVQLEEGISVSLPWVYMHLGSINREEPPHFSLGSTGLV